MTGSEHAERFTHLRPLLFTIVYEILGSATESDDVLQDSYLRWAEVDLATVRDTKSYLAQLVTRQALNALRAVTLMKAEGPMTRAEAFLHQARIAHQRGEERRAVLWARKAKSEDPNLQEADEFLRQIEG